MRGSFVGRERPKSPNIHIYRPQPTSVMSLAHRISGVVTSFAAVSLVLWPIAIVAGPQTYATAQSVLGSPLGQIGLVVAIFTFSHLCEGIRHLAWDAVYGFDLAAIYASGWAMVAASIVLTAATWAAVLFMTR